MSRKLTIKITTNLSLIVEDDFIISKVMDKIRPDFYSTDCAVTIDNVEMITAEIEFIHKVL